MSLSASYSHRKRKPVRLRPTREEGLYVQFVLKRIGTGFSEIGKKLGKSNVIVFNVVFGRRHSARVEAEIARILGKADWNEVVLEARSAVTGKPVKTLVKEFSHQVAARKKAALERISADISAELASGKRRAG